MNIAKRQISAIYCCFCDFGDLVMCSRYGVWRALKSRVAA